MLFFWFLMPVLGVMVVAAVGLRVAASLAAFRTSRRAIAEVEQAARAADGTGEIALVRGKLRIVGEGCNPPESDWGNGCAATGSWSSAWRLVRKEGEHVDGEQAERLMIESRDGLFELGGEIEVRMGSRLSLGGRRDASTKKFMSRTALFDGDEVVAAGVRGPASSDAHEGAVHYRAPAAGVAVLSPRKHMGLPIVATRLSRTTVAPSAMFFSLALLPAWLVAIAGGGFVALDSRTPESYYCRSLGHCSWLFHATSDDDCRAAITCLRRGECTEERGRCVTRSERDCDLSLNCLQDGHCLLWGDTCTASHESLAGLCMGTDWPELRDTIQCDVENEACGGSPGRGACTPLRRPSSVRPGDCVDVECAASCAETTMCHLYGFCGDAGEQWCVATEEGCASSERCRLHGICSLDGERGCVPGPKGEACIRSEACAKYGWCVPTQYENDDDDHHHVCFSRDLSHERLPPGRKGR